MRIVVFGGTNMDLVAHAPRLPLPGESLSGERFVTSPGGKAGCQAVAAARLGVDSVFVGRVGADRFGEELVASMRAAGVDTSGAFVDPDSSSGVAMIWIDANAQNSIVFVPGATGRLDEADVDRLDAYLDRADALMLQLEAPLAASHAAARRSHARGVRVILDPAPAQPLPDELYTLSDIITPNEVEAAQLLGTAVRTADDGVAAARELVARGTRAAIVKMSSLGAAWSERTGEAVAAGFVPAFPVRAVDTVGAGDAFNAALTVALCEGRSLPYSVRYGAAAGALAACRPGAQSSMPTRTEVDALVERYPDADDSNDNQR